MFTISSAIKGYLIKGVLVLVCIAAVWLNVQLIIAKNKRLAAQENTITQLTQVNENLKKDMVKKGKSETVTEVSKEGVKQADVKHEKAKTQANQYVEKKLADIEKKYAAMEQNAANAERKRTEVSLERAKGLWLSYCLQEPEERACK